MTGAKKIAIVAALAAGAFLLSRRANAATAEGQGAADGLSWMGGVGGGGTGSSFAGSGGGFADVLGAIGAPAPSTSYVQPTSAPIVTTTASVASAATTTAPTTTVPQTMDTFLRQTFGYASGQTSEPAGGD